MCHHITEIIDGKLLYTFTWNSYIYLLDCLNLDPDSKKILDTENSADLIFRSEINPKLLYICENDFNVQNRKADLYAFDVNDFCDINKKEKKPLFNFRNSNSNKFLDIVNMIINTFFWILFIMVFIFLIS